jgi:hypothetical protein
MKISYHQAQEQTSHFTAQTENPVKTIRIVKHLNSLDRADSLGSTFSENLVSKNSEFQRSKSKNAHNHSCCQQTEGKNNSYTKQ